MKEIYITIIIAGAILLAPLFLGMGVRYVPLNIQPSLEQTEKIYGRMVVSQSVKVPANNFSVIGASIKNPNLANKEDLILNVYDNDGRLVRTSTINGKVIPDGNFLKFIFSPIKDSQNKNYQIAFSSPASSKETAFEVFLTNQKQEQLGELTLNGKVIPGEMSLVSFSKPSNPLVTSMDIYKEWFNKFIGDRAFAGLYILTLIAGVLYLIYLSKAKKPSN